MIRDITIDQALIELKRTEKALRELRQARKTSRAKYPSQCDDYYAYHDQVKEHAAAKRASLDLTRKLADLRAGR